MAFTNTMIFDISHYVIQRRYREEIPRWRGDRLACIGDGCDPSDFDKLWTKEELATFKELSATKKSDCDEHRFNLHSILFDSGAFKEVKFRQDGGVYLWQYTDERCREENLRSDLKLRAGDMRSSLSFELLTVEPQGEVECRQNKKDSYRANPPSVPVPLLHPHDVRTFSKHNCVYA